MSDFPSPYNVSMSDRDTKSDIYEYMLDKIAITGQNGQFRNHHIFIHLMVERVAPSSP